MNGLDITRRPRNMWIIDFGVGMSEEDAAKYEAVFRYAEEHVKPVRATNARETYKRFWWRHVESRPAMRKALAPLKRFLVTMTVSKHRLFAWMESPVQPDHQLFAFAREDDYFMGILQSKVHEVWALAQGTQLREKESGFRYTPSSCFETFPFPDLTGPDGEAKREAVAEAARELDELRTRWLNPPEWTREDVLEFPGSVNGPWQRHLDPATVDPATGVGLVRYPRRLPRDPASAKLLQKRTLTALYNERPAWLHHAQQKLDETVCELYGTVQSARPDEMLQCISNGGAQNRSAP
ncbi:MAG: type IIL restriction-modification enzyme MmeI [Kiritimatiellia bacterium]